MSASDAPVLGDSVQKPWPCTESELNPTVEFSALEVPARMGVNDKPIPEPTALAMDAIVVARERSEDENHCADKAACGFKLMRFVT